MVSALKRWLGIESLERENLILEKAVKAQKERIEKLEQDQKDNLASIADLEKRLTSEPAKPKIVPKPPKLNWRQVQNAVAKANQELEEA